MKIVWTEEKFTKAKKLKAKGLSFTEVGKELGTTKNAVIGKFHRDKHKAGYTVQRPRGRHNFYYKTIGTGTCYLCNRKYYIQSKFDRFCKSCKKSDMYIGSH